MLLSHSPRLMRWSRVQQRYARYVVLILFPLVCTFLVTFTSLKAHAVVEDDHVDFYSLWQDKRNSHRQLASSSSLNCVIGIFSDYGSIHAQQRRTVRRTWLSSLQQHGYQLTVTAKFILPHESCKTTSIAACDAAQFDLEVASVRQEQLAFGDIVQLPLTSAFPTSLPAATTYMFLQWAAEMEDTDFLLKLNDDVFVDIHQVLGELADMAYEKRTNYWRGFVWRDLQPLRPWHITADRYHPMNQAEHWYPFERFPVHVSGLFWIMSMDLVIHACHWARRIRIFSQHSDAQLGIWLAPIDIEPLHDVRIQSLDVCRDSMLATAACDSDCMHRLHANLATHKPLCNGASISTACPLCWDCDPPVDWSAEGIQCSALGASISYHRFSNDSAVSSSCLSSPSSYVQFDSTLSHRKVTNAMEADDDFAVNQQVASPLIVYGWFRSSSIDDASEADLKQISYTVHIHIEYVGPAFQSRILERSFSPAWSASLFGSWELESFIVMESMPVKRLRIVMNRSVNSRTPVQRLTVVPIAHGLFKDLRSYANALCGGLQQVQRSSSFGDSFILVWTTANQSFALRQRRVIESIFANYPRARVQVFSNTLPCESFIEFVEAGYDIQIIRYSINTIGEGLPGFGWVEGIPRWSTYVQNFYAHLADYIRFVLLYRFGGIYMDFDAILTNRIPPSDSKYILSVDECDTVQDYCLQISRFGPKWFYLPIGFIGFAPESKLLRLALELFEVDYSPSQWPCGTRFLSKAYQAGSKLGLVTQADVLPAAAAYPVLFADREMLFRRNASLWREIVSSSISVHLWGKETSRRKVTADSILHHALTEFTISCSAFASEL